MADISIKEMFEAGVHFGHQSKYWNPKMQPYIYTTHKKLHIINLEKTADSFTKALGFITELAAKNSKIVGADINELSPIKGFNSYNFLVAKLAYKILSYKFFTKQLA